MPKTAVPADQEYRNAVASEIRAWMGRRGYGREELAERIGVNREWVRRRVNGEVALNTDDLIVLARVLECDMGDLLPTHQEVHQKGNPLGTLEAHRHAAEKDGPTLTGLYAMRDLNPQPAD